MPGLGISTFAEQVKEKSHGTIVIETSFDASKGFKSADMMNAVQARKVDAADAFAGGLANKYPIFGVSSLPFLADSLDKARRCAMRHGPSTNASWPRTARNCCTPRRGRRPASGPRRPSRP